MPPAFFSQKFVSAQRFSAPFCYRKSSRVLPFAANQPNAFNARLVFSPPQLFNRPKLPNLLNLLKLLILSALMLPCHNFSAAQALLHP